MNYNKVFLLFITLLYARQVGRYKKNANTSDKKRHATRALPTISFEKGLSPFENHFIRNQSDKLAVGGFIVGSIYLDAENAVDIFDFSSVSGNLNRVTDGSFDLTAARFELVCDGRIKFFGYVIDYIGRVHNHLDGFP